VQAKLRSALTLQQNHLETKYMNMNYIKTTKQCLHFLAERAGSVGNVEQRILMANPVGIVITLEYSELTRN
jgi:hypothetical protein